jgi:hypothetical protein
LSANIDRVPRPTPKQFPRPKKLLSSHTVPLGLGCREIHSSERRKPSEVSLRRGMDLSPTANGHAPDLKSWGCLGHRNGLTRIGLERGVCTML